MISDQRCDNCKYWRLSRPNNDGFPEGICSHPKVRVSNIEKRKYRYKDDICRYFWPKE